MAGLAAQWLGDSDRVCNCRLCRCVRRFDSDGGGAAGRRVDDLMYVAPTVTTLTWRWNLRYGVICYVVLVGIFALLEA